MFHQKWRKKNPQKLLTMRRWKRRKNVEGKNKFTRVIFRHDMAREVFALHNSFFFGIFCKWLYTIHGNVFSKSVCHMFFLPFKWCVFWLFFPFSLGLQYTFFSVSLKVVWRCSNICLVDSISFLLFSFLFRPKKTKKYFLARHSCNNTAQEKVCKLFRHKKTRILSCGASLPCFW